MKFSCERCGKRYATADRPSPGRSYKLKCKACGHLIVVKVAAGEGAAGPRVETPDGARLVVAPAANAPPAPRNPSPSEVTMPTLPDAGALTPPPSEAGYVDLFSDLAEDGPEAGRDDPLPGAERASLSGGSGPGACAPGPIGPSEAPSERTPARAVPAPLPAPKVPVFPKPPQQRSTLPLVIMGIGVLLLVGILAFVMLSTGTRAPPAEPPREQAVSAPEPPPAAAPPAAAPAPGSKADARRRREREGAAARAKKAPPERATSR